jgi:hypothetical protein
VTLNGKLWSSDKFGNRDLDAVTAGLYFVRAVACSSSASTVVPVAATPVKAAASRLPAAAPNTPRTVVTRAAAISVNGRPDGSRNRSENRARCADAPDVRHAR